MKRYCQCEVRDFDFESYPGHVHYTSTFAWRPIILATVLREQGAVFYVEPTTRFKNPNAANFLRMRGTKSFFLWDYPKFTSLVAYTDPDMFAFMGEKRCSFTDCSLLSPEAMVLYRTEDVWTELLKPWLKCALNKDCISPPAARHSGCFEIRNPRTTGCHRYDMSALSILLNRLHQYTIGTEKMVSFRLTYTDDTEVAAFAQQPWTYSQLMMLVASPVLLYLVWRYWTRRRRASRLF